MTWMSFLQTLISIAHNHNPLEVCFIAKTWSAKRFISARNHTYHNTEKSCKNTL